MTIKVASMFAGVGGICQAFKDVGCEIVWANELDTYACETYKTNMKFKYKEECNYLIEGDICEILQSDNEIPDFDILCAGFPCQSFSIAGDRLGFNDERGQLFYRVMDMIVLKNPSIVFLENVKNLRSHDDGNTFDIIKKELEDKGYIVKDKILNATEFGIPQNRERIYILASKENGLFDFFEWPVGFGLEQMAINFIDTKHRKEDKYYYLLDGVYRGRKNKDSVKDKSEKYNAFIQQISDNNSIYQIRRGMYVRQNKKGVCPTLTANMGTGGHNVPLIRDDFGVRKLTPEECFVLQGFDRFVRPKRMSDSHLYKQVGNSVVVPVIKRIAESILNALGGKVLENG